MSTQAVEKRTYFPNECIVFSKTNAPFGGLSNMAAGFPLSIGGIRILTAEALYQACRFPHMPEVQKLIIGENSPMTAKMRGKPYRKKSRPDWDQVRVKVMRWVLRVKLAQNYSSFSRLLLETDQKSIVELSRRDDFWGAKQVSEEKLAGANVLGRLLMELREEIRTGGKEQLIRIEPLDLPDFLLIGKPIVTVVGVIEDKEREPDLLDEMPKQPASMREPIPEQYQPTATVNTPNATKSDVETSVTKKPQPLPGRYPKRLIEVDLPIKRISVHSRREKSIRHGHISTLHIWWARRPLAACRAVICAALWPDPADPLCPPGFVQAAREQMLAWTLHERQMLLSVESRPRFEAARKNTRHFDKPEELRAALLDFIADFANWDNSTVREYLDTSRALTQAAHEALGGAPGTRPLVVDPFAGGGSIPLEALRVGADAFASDLNPVAVLLNKVVLQYIPKYGQHLADEVRKWGEWIRREAEKELAKFYPKDKDGATPIAYLWARTIQCEGPGCGAGVPLMRSLWLAKKGAGSVALRVVSDSKTKSIGFEIVKNAKAKDVGAGSIRRGSVTCPCCGFSTPVTSVRMQLKSRRGGTTDARLIAVRFDDVKSGERSWRLPNSADLSAAKAASTLLERRKHEHKQRLSLVPDELLPPEGTLGFRIQKYGMREWGDLFSPRQALALTTLGRLVREAKLDSEPELTLAVRTCLALAVDRLADFNASLCVLNSVGGRGVVHVFGRQALPMVWDFMETNPFNTEAANWQTCFDVVDEVISFEKHNSHSGHVERADATKHPLPDDSAAAFITDPPYYDAVPYADLSDFFYVWLRRNLPNEHHDLLSNITTPKDDECIVDEVRGKNRISFETMMAKAMADGRRVLQPNGIAMVVFAHKSTAGWEAMLQAMIDAGLVITGSWPIDTERPGRLRAQDSAALASSVHLVCRPRENLDGSIRASEIGDWRDVLQDLPRRIHEWMPRLAEEGVVGADAIFACLGPALEVFSRYSHVEKASGEIVALKEYLEHVWAAVAKEALAQVFKDADTASFEPDARLTAMWLWTLNAGKTNGADADGDEEDADDEEDANGKVSKAKGGFVLEYDAARKIAQGLGANLEDLGHVVEVSGETARLLPVSERTEYLFGKEQSQMPPGARKKAKAAQMDLFGELAQAGDSEAVWGEKTVQRVGETTLDRVHQGMILFATGRSEALKRFLVDDGAGRDARFWGLAQALSALYPQAATEKRWVDGVLARKKGLGL